MGYLLKLSTQEWKGKDLLGQLLENTREALKGARGINIDQTQDDDMGEPRGDGDEVDPLPSSEDEEDYEECESDSETSPKEIHNEQPHATSPLPPESQSSVGSEVTGQSGILGQSTGQSTGQDRSSLNSPPSLSTSAPGKKRRNPFRHSESVPPTEVPSTVDSLSPSQQIEQTPEGRSRRTRKPPKKR